MSFPKAPAVSVVRTLAASAGRTASTSEELNAQRFTDRVFAKHDLSLPIAVNSLEHEVVDGVKSSIDTYHMTPHAWLSHLLQVEPPLLAGPGVTDPGPSFDAFWQTFRLSNPEHKVYELHSHELHRVVPVLLHGDEGRSQKKSSYLILSFQSPIGGMPRPIQPCNCADVLRSRPDLPDFGPGSPEMLPPEVQRLAREMYTNYRGHSFLSRFFLFGVGAWVFKRNAHVVDKLLEEMVASFDGLFTQGLVCAEKKYFASIVGIKGDMDFFAKYFSLTRSYSQVVSRGLGYICHQCMASAGAQSQIGFEDVREDPVWAGTMYQERPWEGTPALSNLPGYEFPEQLIKGDPFHIVKLGVGRDLAGGIIVTLARKGFWDHAGSTQNIVHRLQRAHSMFVLFCSVSKLRPSLKGFSKEFFHIKNFLSSPWANSKGSDTMILLKFLEWYLRLNQAEPAVPGYASLISVMLQTVTAALGMFHIMHSHRLWLDRACGALLYVQCMRVVRGFKVLSKKCLEMNIRSFVMKPKLHALHHCAHNLKYQLQTGSPLILSLEAVSCEVDEDYIGRCSRLSRRVCIRVCDKRVIQRIFLKTKAILRKRRKKP